MRISTRVHFVFLAASLVVVGAPLCGQDAAPPPEPAESFYATSLHATNRGIEFVYSKEHGGLERLTGMSATELGCTKAKCHVRNCDTCHKSEADGKASFTTDPARIQRACDRCHPVAKDDPDVHFSKGMRCMRCHTAREIHGDGTAWETYMRPGALDARCETCHTGLSPTASHTVHRGKLDCAACHTGETTTCLNCHVETRLAQGKDSSIPVSGIVFLVNHDSRVTTGNLLSYVYRGRTMITVAPAYFHSITRKGRTCADCHGSPIVASVAAGTFVPFRWENGAMTATAGVVPVVDGVDWKLPFLDRRGDGWVPLTDAPAPLLNYSGFCTPLSREQLARLEKPRGAR